MITCKTASAQSAPLGGPGPHQYWAYIGNTSTDGIGLFKLDADAGTLTPAGIAAPAHGPDFLAIAPNQKFLYAGVATDAPPGSAGGVEGFAIDAVSGKLTPINQQSSEGDEAAFVTVDPSGRNVLAANYAAATATVLPIDASGKLSPASCVVHETGSSVDPVRQTHAYTHSINCDPAGNFAITCDLGADKLFIYKFDAAAGKLTPNDPPSVSVPAGSGPRHLTFSPNGRFVYQINEMGATVICFAFDATAGTLRQVQSVKLLKDDVKGNTSAEVQIDPSGRFLYASNRLTTNYLTIFSIDPQSGQLTLVGYQDSLGKTPRNFRIEPTGRYMLLANQNSDTLVLFAIDQATGKLTPVGQPVPTVHGPICVKFVAVGTP
ncbi:MAG: lactonase family protein [Tepidisphaeraceae bacterium]|jgi:6-phosphogluconolactonase